MNNGGGIGSGRASWRVGGFTFVRRADVRAGESVMEVIPPFWIDRWAVESTLASVLRSLLQQTSVAGMLSAITHDPGAGPKTLRNALNEAVRRREIVMLRDQAGPASSGGGPNNSASATAAGPPRRSKSKPPPPPPKQEKTWVEFRLVNQDSKPMKGASYRLKISDGSVRVGNLDDAGSVRVPSLDPGMCEISFLDYDQGEWKRI